MLYAGQYKELPSGRMDRLLPPPTEGRVLREPCISLCVQQAAPSLLVLSIATGQDTPIYIEFKLRSLTHNVK
jgi:hypothetical protein